MAAKIIHLVQTIELRRLIQASLQLQQRILELFPDRRDLEEDDLKDFFSEARVDRLEDPTDDNQIIRLIRDRRTDKFARRKPSCTKIAGVAVMSSEYDLCQQHRGFTTRNSSAMAAWLVVME
jgi:hypothetical protein